MKTKTLLTVIFILCVRTAFSQEITEPSRDIGFNTNFLFEGIFNSGTTPFAMMYKKYVSENRANRFGIDLSFNLDEIRNEGPGSYREFSGATIRLLLGKEIQKPVNLKWIWFFGGDLEPFYSYYKSQTYESVRLFSTNKSSDLGLNLRPFIAIRYNINTRLYLSTEASVNLRYSFQKQYADYVQAAHLNQDIEGHHISFHARSAYGIFIFYRF